MTARWVDPYESVEVRLTVNGEAIEAHVPPRRTLSDALRDAGFTSVHLGCEHGVCGACTVLVDGAPVRSCLMLAIQGAHHLIETVESLSDDGELGALQQAFDANDALQCGFCTPGFLMLIEGLMRLEADATARRVTETVSSNLCRCTGATPIVEAALQYQRARRGAV